MSSSAMRLATPLFRRVARLCRPAALAGLALAVLATGGLPVSAQDVLRPPGMVPRPPANVPQGGFNLFGGWTLFQPQRPQVEQAPAPKRPPPEPEGVVYGSADEAIQGKKQPPEKFVLVLGDALGAQLAQGLADSYVKDRANPAVIARTEDDLGLLPPAQGGGADLLARLPDAVSAAKAGATLIVLGSADLRPIRDGDQMVEPLTDRWTELYGRRLDEVFTVLRQKAPGVVIVGLAPVASAETSAQYEKLNDVLRTHAARAGLTFAPVWDGFVDEEGKFAPFGAAVDGQRRRLRLNDGVRFTKAGARKLAFFAEKDITRLLAEPKADAPGLVGPGGRPVLSLTDGPRGAAMLSGGAGPAQVIPAAASPAAPLAGEAARVLRDGAPLAAVPGRADDYSWPPKSAPSQP